MVNMKYGGIDHVNIKIPEDNLEECLEFYRDKLGFKPEKLDLYREGERTSFAFRISEEAMLHIRSVDDFGSPEGDNFDHFCILVDGELEQLKDRIDEENIEREETPWGATGRAPAIYVRDPFGYVIEFKENM